MLRFVLGKSGCGKTHYIYDQLCDLAKSGENKIIMLVPDQSSFETEKDFLEMLGAKLCKNVLVVGFSRLCHFVFELAHIQTKNAIDDSTRAVIMSLALEQIDDNLELFKGNYNKKSVIDVMLGAVKECKKAKISTELLRQTALLIKDDTLKKKLVETALIIDTYNSVVEQSYVDPLDNLTKVFDLLKNNNFFSGYTLAIDSFSGFSNQQLDVIKMLFLQCKDVFVSLDLDPNSINEESLFFATTQTYNTLKNIAKKENIEIKVPIKLTENFRTNSNELKIIGDNIYRSKLSENNIDDDINNKDIFVLSTKDIYDECENVAKKIKELIIEKNYLYSDIAVICRDIAPYSGILNTIFEKYEIPFFMDMSYDVYIKPVIRYVCSIFNIILNSWQKDDIMAFLKTGLTQNTAEEIADFENYIFVWNINGVNFKKEFKNNPDGYSSHINEQNEKKLKNAEKVRKSVVEPLIQFKEDIKDKTGRQITELLYKLLENMQITNSISLLYDELEFRGEISLANEQVRLWNLLVEVFDKMVAVLGDVKVSAKRYFELMSLRFSLLEMADIPRTLDSVTVGTALRVRLNNQKVVFLIGCIDGIFPAVPSSGGLFSSFEQKILIANNLHFGDELSELADFENFMAYKSVTAPSEKLFVSFYQSDLQGNSYLPSSIVTEISKIFPNIRVEDSISLTNSYNSVWAILPAFEECANGIKKPTSENIALQNYFSNNEKFKEKYIALLRAVEGKPFQFANEKNAELLFGKDLKISASQIEKFSLCRFSYFCNYGLRVKERVKAEINSMEYGTFVHYVMEVFFKNYSKSEINSFSDDDINSICDKILDNYINEHFGGEENNNARFMYKFIKIRENIHFLVKYIIKELNQSAFEVADCELKIGGEISEYSLELPSGHKIFVRGSIDRVDIMKRNEESFIRIIDYKTGSKIFKLSDVLYGLNLQMLIYLYSLKINGEARYGKIIPSAILYMPATTPIISSYKQLSDAEIEKEIGKKLKMNGILLNSFDVIDNCSNVYISYKEKDGTLSAGGTLATLEELGMIFKKIDLTIAEMGKKLYCGDVNAKPTKGAKDACEYCPYDSICAYNKNGFVNVFEMKNNEVCLALKNEVGEEE